MMTRTYNIGGRTPDPDFMVPFDDVEDSYRLAMESKGIPQDIIDEIAATVEDYIEREYA